MSRFLSVLLSGATQRCYSAVRPDSPSPSPCPVDRGAGGHTNSNNTPRDARVAAAPASFVPCLSMLHATGPGSKPSRSRENPPTCSRALLGCGIAMCTSSPGSIGANISDPPNSVVGEAAPMKTVHSSLRTRSISPAAGPVEHASRPISSKVLSRLSSASLERAATSLGVWGDKLAPLGAPGATGAACKCGPPAASCA